MEDSKFFSRCVSCFDEVSGTRGFSCSAGHELCLPCSAIFTRHSCEKAALGAAGAVPLKCPLSTTCKLVLPECEIDRVLLAVESSLEEFRGVTAKYHKECVVSAINDRDAKEELPVMCAFCGEYAEVFVPPRNPAIWSEVDKRMYAGLDKLEQAEATQLRAKKLQIEWEHVENLRKSREQTDKANKSLTTQKKQLVDEAFRDVWSAEEPYILERIELEMKERSDNIDPKHVNLYRRKALHSAKSDLRKQISRQVEDAFIRPQRVEASRLDANTLNEKLKQAEQQYADNMKAHRRKARQNHDWKKIAKQVLEENSAAPGFEHKEIPEAKQAQMMKDVAVTPRKPPVASKKGQAGHAPVVKKVWVKKGEQSNDKPAVRKQQYGEWNETNKFFECKKNGCPGAMCLACGKHLKRDEIPAHECILNPVEYLYSEVIETLANASTKTCPKCLFPGQKDENCTHISCDRCDSHWCYHCGKEEQSIPGGFDSHNRWSKHKPKPDTCPMDLTEKYGGTSEEALMRFHLELQKEAIERLRSRTDAELWEKLLQEKFPKGIFQDTDRKQHRNNRRKH
eukprot:TRINITY_DN2057_c0_g1_i2.p1 TRINITY_DN2057_c0_g1~~TRINITY_DN2057_c0_g1_i2.p1  ORF type:complete len:567 (-),score=144.39 TRINITY_DN2057_c0_g1_i2:1650-3350(-)